MQTNTADGDGAPRKEGESDSGLEIAAMLARSGYLADQQLNYAQRVKKKLLSPRTLVAVMLELGFFTKEQLRETLRGNIVSVKLGSLLVELGYLKPAELQAALGIQREGDHGKMIGEILVEQRFIEEFNLAQCSPSSSAIRTSNWTRRQSTAHFWLGCRRTGSHSTASSRSRKRTAASWWRSRIR